MIPLIGLILTPALIWGWIFYHQQFYKKHQLRLFIYLIINGILAAFLSLFLNHSIEKFSIFWPGAVDPSIFIYGINVPIFSSIFWMLVGFNEEFSKLLFFLLTVYHSKKIEDEFDGILFIVVISLSFAKVENIIYYLQYGKNVVITRSFITIPAHVFMSIPIGLFTSISKRIIVSNKNKFNFFSIFLILTGFFYSAIIHGFYDLILSLGFSLIAYLFIIILGFQSFFLSKHALKKSIIRKELFKSS